MRKILIYISLSLVCLIVSIASALLLTSEIKKRNGQILFTNYTILNEDRPYYDLPNRIVLEQLNLDLPVESKKLENNIWVYSDNSVVFLQDSGHFSDNGNKVLYGHNYPNLLGKIKDTEKGDIIKIYANNIEYIYSVDSVMTVTPDQTHILKQTNDNRITIFTCSGFLDSKRLVVTAVKI